MRSGHDGKIGAAAVMMTDGMEIQTLRYHLGSETEHTVYEAEVIAVILALHMLTTLKRKLKKVTIGTVTTNHRRMSWKERGRMKGEMARNGICRAKQRRLEGMGHVLTKRY